MRFVCLVSLAISLASGLACNRRANARRFEREMERNAGKTIPPQDPIFIDFAKNWRQLVSTSPQLALPVVANPQQPPWQPQVFSQCVFSPDAGGNVPQVTLTWNESAGGIIEAPRAQKAAQAQPAAMRFDVGLHQDAFARNYFSSALAADRLKRFNIPSNAALVSIRRRCC
jgi:hypothetical protein